MLFTWEILKGCRETYIGVCRSCTIQLLRQRQPASLGQNTTLTTAKTNVLRLEALNKFIVEKEKHTGQGW